MYMGPEGHEHRSIQYPPLDLWDSGRHADSFRPGRTYTRCGLPVKTEHQRREHEALCLICRPRTADDERALMQPHVEEYGSTKLANQQDDDECWTS